MHVTHAHIKLNPYSPNKNITQYIIKWEIRFKVGHLINFLTFFRKRTVPAEKTGLYGGKLIVLTMEVSELCPLVHTNLAIGVVGIWQNPF